MNNWADKNLTTLQAIIIGLLFFMPPLIRAQTSGLSQEATISVVTIGPGSELADRFGHSAFRVNDPQQEIDWAYNYGTYDFNTPHFYLKFVQGQLLYSLSVNYFEAFLNHYKQQNRSVNEQVLALTNTQKNELFAYLQWNAQPANKAYRYDFFFDNCATRIRDVLVHQLGEELVYVEDYVVAPKTFRMLIQEQVPYNTWGSLGMDVAIGAVVDRPASAWDHQFLPKYVLAANSIAQRKDSSGLKPLTAPTKVVFAARAEDQVPFSWYSPMVILSLLSSIMLWMTYRDWRANCRTPWIDAVIFGATGSIGVLLLLLWFATDHSATKMNYNILWAMPLSLFFIRAIGAQRPQPWVGRYVLFLILMLALMLIHQFSGVQSFAPTLWVLWLGLTTRLLYVYRVLK